MDLWDIEAYIDAEVQAYCKAKGYTEQEGVNNLTPHNCARAFQMAKRLTQQGFDAYIAIAPEGFIYSYFFEKLGAKILSVFSDYPSTRIETQDDLSVIRGKRVLIIEDDVIGGGTLRLLAEFLQPFAPKELSVYLGHNKNVQRLKSVPPEYAKAYVAENELEVSKWSQYERELIEFFQVPSAQ